MKHLRLYEEFNPYSGVEFAKKLRLYAEASPVATRVTEIARNGSDLVFDIFSNVPQDDKGFLLFHVIVPIDNISRSRVVVKAKNTIIRTDSLSPKGENDISVILMNFIEIASLYDDTVVSYIVDSSKEVNSVEDIKRIISKLGQ